MGNVRAAVVLSLVAAAATGCADIRSWAYNPEPRSAVAPTVASSLVVPPLIDRRTNENSNHTLLYMIPLVPYGSMEYHTPEGTPVHVTSGQWKFSPPDDLARAIAQEIDAARVFQEAFTDSRPSQGTYLLSGEIISTDYDGSIISYCLSVYGPLLWFFGLPAGTSTNKLDLRLTLTRPPAEAPLWRYTIQGESKKTHWLYGMGTDFRYDQVLKAQMPAMIESLRAAAAGLR